MLRHAKQRRLWAAAILVGAAACAHRAAPTAPAPPDPPRLAPITTRALLLPAGERLVWEVRSDGFPVGRAELVAGERELRSRFRTSSLLSSLAAIRHELITTVDRPAARPSAARETLDLRGELTRIDAVFDGARVTVDAPARSRATVPGGNPAHTVHSALGWLRAWAAPDARPGFVFVLILGQLYRLDVARPRPVELRGAPALRVDCRAGIYASAGEPLELSIWLAATDRREPLRVQLTSSLVRVTADLIERADQ